jgi:N-acetylmuramoyl-L-alanine amidase
MVALLFIAVVLADEQPGEALAVWPEATVFPAVGAPLLVPPWRVSGKRPLKLALDAGHGRPGKPGNIGVFCQREADHVLSVCQDTARAWAGRPGLEVLMLRDSTDGGEYTERVGRANALSDALVSVHTDSRGPYTREPNGEGVDCLRSPGGHQGIGVLWSDRGDPELVAERKRLAVAVIDALVAAGFPPYRGEDYVGLYEEDPEHPGLFVDRHEPQQMVYFLHGPNVPSIIIETHLALDADEALAWERPETRAVFERVLGAALLGWWGAVPWP